MPNQCSNANCAQVLHKDARSCPKCSAPSTLRVEQRSQTLPCRHCGQRLVIEDVVREEHFSNTTMTNGTSHTTHSTDIIYLPCPQCAGPKALEESSFAKAVSFCLVTVPILALIFTAWPLAIVYYICWVVWGKIFDKRGNLIKKYMMRPSVNT